MEEQGNKDEMDETQKACIQDNQQFFVTNMYEERTVLDCLLSLGVLSMNMVEEISSKMTRAQRVRELNIMITTRPAFAFNAYHRALIISGNTHLAKQLEPYLSQDLENVQGAKRKKGTVAYGGAKKMAGQAKAGTATSGEPSAGVSTVSQQTQHIMISYHEENQRTMEDVGDKLRKEHGYSVWMDVNDMTGNKDDAKSKAVQDSFVVLVAGCKEYIKSHPCKKEAQYADELEKPIIPLSMEKNFKASGWFGIITKSKTPIEFTTAVAFDISFNKLLKELKAIRPRLD